MSLILLLFFIIYEGKKSTLEIPVASLNTPVVCSLFLCSMCQQFCEHA